VVERLGLLQSSPKTSPVLDVAVEAADPGIEDILQSVFPEEQVAEHSYAPSHRANPEPAQLGDGVYFAFLSFEIRNKFF
jgi:hypothetical protein